MEAGEKTTTAGSPTKVGDPESGGWAKGTLKPQEPDESPAERPKPRGENSFITRSDRKRD